MEFDDIGGLKQPDAAKDNNGDSSKSKPKLAPPPLQDSKDYYNSTQRMTEAMIKNPQFQIYSIDEEESIRTSVRESTREDDPRLSVDSIN